MFDDIRAINARPEPFEFYSAHDLWTDEHTSEQMLKYHLAEDLDLASLDVVQRHLHVLRTSHPESY